MSLRYCERCHGCADDYCGGGCGSPRWCNAQYHGFGCDACHKPVMRPAWAFRPAALVHCMLNRRHSGDCSPGSVPVELPQVGAAQLVAKLAKAPPRRIVFRLYTEGLDQ